MKKKYTIEDENYESIFCGTLMKENDSIFVGTLLRENDKYFKLIFSHFLEDEMWIRECEKNKIV